MRNAKIVRNTAETKIEIALTLDGKGRSEIATGCGFLDHMLTLFASHGRFDLCVECKGDTYVDDHHTVEDIGIVLGLALKEAAGDMKGIKRFSDILMPMDEALVMCALDYSGRSYLHFESDFASPMIGDYDTQMTVEFLRAFAFNAGITLHAKVLYGENDHHKVEAVYKAVAKCLKKALAVVSDSMPSSKGSL